MDTRYLNFLMSCNHIMPVLFCFCIIAFALTFNSWINLFSFRYFCTCNSLTDTIHKTQRLFEFERMVFLRSWKNPLVEYLIFFIFWYIINSISAWDRPHSLFVYFPLFFSPSNRSFPWTFRWWGLRVDAISFRIKSFLFKLIWYFT